jgi:hypothetical protein
MKPGVEVVAASAQSGQAQSAVPWSGITLRISSLVMSDSPVDPSSNPNPSEVGWRHWVQWALFVAAVSIIGVITIVGTAARKPWVFALF